MDSELRFYQPGLPNYTISKGDVVYSKFTISEVALKPKSRQLNAFELDIMFMHGDADHYTSHRHVYSNTEGSIKGLLEHATFLRKCMALYPNGKRGGSGYWEVEGYKEYGDDFPLENECCDGHAFVETFGIIYVDSKGVEFPVILE